MQVTISASYRLCSFGLVQSVNILLKLKDVLMHVYPEVFPFKTNFFSSHIMKKNRIVVTLVLITLPCVHALGTVLVKLYDYSNSAGRKYDGQCCDGTIPGCPLDHCDHHFHICIGALSSHSDCTYGQADLTGPDNTNVIKFENVAASSFQFGVWNGGVQVRINVSDVDSDDSQLVDYFIYDYTIENVGLNQTVATERKLEITGNRPNQQTRLFFGISAFCDQHYYGHDCSIKCVGQNGCDGHYSCDDKGKKVCRPGWSGPECTEQINEGEADCRVYIDRPDFGASSWTGTYNCSIQLAVVPIALNLTTTDGNIAVNGYITFGNIQTLITGTFAHVAKLLVVQTPSDLKFLEMGHAYTSAELNLLLTTPKTFDGSIAFLGDTRSVCGAHFSRQEVYFGGCNFQGSCIRYGMNRDEYYCCCHNGFTGKNCETRFEGPVLG